MADYYPLISRAVAGLSDKSPDMRRAVYDRAQTALLEQLRSLDPPLSDDDIARERAALDEAIDRIEVDYGGVVDEPQAYEPEAGPAEPARPAAGAAPRHRGEPEERFARRADQADGSVVDRQPSSDEPRREGQNGGYAWPEPQLFERAPGSPDAPAPTKGFVVPESRRRPDLDEFVAASEEAPPVAQRDRGRPRIDSVAPRSSSGGRRRAAIMGAALLLVVGGIGFTAYTLQDEPVAPPAQTPVAAAPPASSEGKITERVGGEPVPSAPAAPVPVAPAPPPQAPSTAAPAPGASPPAEARSAPIAVAQRAVLYEEIPGDPQAEPRATPGRAIWQLDNVNAGQGQPLETAVRSIVEIDAGLRLEILMRRNLDPTLPASHTIELIFTNSGDASRDVRDVGLLQLKGEEAVRGAPLAGLPVPVKDNLFLIGLSNLQTEIDRNQDLLLRRNWIDLPIRFANGQRAIISFEKGVSGEQVVNQALAQWEAQPTPAGATR